MAGATKCISGYGVIQNFGTGTGGACNQTKTKTGNNDLGTAMEDSSLYGSDILKLASTPL